MLLKNTLMIYFLKCHYRFPDPGPEPQWSEISSHYTTTWKLSAWSFQVKMQTQKTISPSTMFHESLKYFWQPGLPVVVDQSTTHLCCVTLDCTADGGLQFKVRGTCMMKRLGQNAKIPRKPVDNAGEMLVFLKPLKMPFKMPALAADA